MHLDPHCPPMDPFGPTWEPKNNEKKYNKIIGAPAEFRTRDLPRATPTH